eukprot:COSAG03_NODE_3338_length_2071_cov_2.092292_4_plen_74_part_01
MARLIAPRLLLLGAACAQCAAGAATRRDAAAAAAAANTAPPVQPNVLRSLSWWEKTLSEQPSAEGLRERGGLLG